MSNPGRFSSQRARTVFGVSAVGVVLAAAGVLGGVGFAKNSVSAMDAQYGKSAICHKTHSKKHPFHTITVSNAAVPAHVRHGDTMGACGTTTTTTSTTTTTISSSSTTTTAVASASTSSGPGKSGGHGKGGGNGQGGGKGHGPKK